MPRRKPDPDAIDDREDLTALEILVRARELITDPAHWTREELCTDAIGRPVDVDSPEATCFCALGAVYRVVLPEKVTTETHLKTPGIVDLLREHTPVVYQDDISHLTINMPIVRVNDDLGHQAVLDMYDAAIASIRGYSVKGAAA